VFLDALAQWRHAQGLPATSMAFGLWDVDTGLSQWLSEADLQRMRRQGLPAISAEEGLALFDAAVASGEPALVPVRVDQAALRARTDEIPALLRGLVPVSRRRSTAGGGGADDAAQLRARLRGVAATERGTIVRELVLAHAASALGHSDVAALDPERDFLESGFDSLAAMELRNNLNTVTGLRLPPMVVFDSKTPLELARVVAEMLDEELDSVTGAGSAPAGGVRSTGGIDTVSELFRGAVLSGNAATGFDLLRAVGRLRPRFRSPADLERLPAPVRLADGPGRPRVICLSTPMATGGVHQHARIAAPFRGKRPVFSLPNPGFAHGDALPDSVEALTQVLARSVLQAAEGEPFVLLGYSSGGTLAHATASVLERTEGVSPAGIVLLDTYRVDADDTDQWKVMEQMSVGLVEKDSEFELFDGTVLSAMGCYFDMVPTFKLDRVEAPVLFVAAEQSFIPVEGEGEGAQPASDAWRTKAWDPAFTARSVAATHFSIIEEDAAKTAGIVDEWLSALD
jgi:acyl carrier protein